MRHSIFLFICLLAFLFGPCLFLGALEIELTEGLDNMTFHPDRAEGVKDSDENKNFKNYLYFFGDLVIQSNSFEKIGFKAQLSRDNILKNTFCGQARANFDYLNMEFGLYAGIEDKFAAPEVGIKGGFELVFPGIIFFSLDGSATLASRLDFFSDNTRETAEVKIGFWLPYVVPSVTASIKAYNKKHDDTVVLRDELIRLLLSADIHIKKFPLQIRIDSGFERYSRTYDTTESSDENLTDRISAIFAGVEAKIQVHKLVKVIVGVEMPVYCFVKGPMNKPPFYTLFKAYAGFGMELY